MTTGDQPAWAGFWRRVGAFVIDGLIVGTAGVLIGMTAFDAMAKLGEPARLVGLSLGVVYFGVLGSRIAGGQTVGKRLLGLRVQTLDGAPLSLVRALGRAFVLCGPLVLNGVAGRTDGGVLVYGGFVLAATALFGVGLAQIYLLIFNRPSRRLVHDILCGTVVLRTNSLATEAPVAAVHRRVAAGIVAVVFVLLAGTTIYFSVRMPAVLADLKSPMAAVQSLPEVMTAGVASTTSVVAVSGQGKTTSHSLAINARLKAWPAAPEAEAQRIGRAVLAVYRPAPGQMVTVTLRYGFDMGFASSWRSYGALIPLQTATPPATRPI
jgi:uncharacterized RDD family membrane protein YckC